MGRKLIDLTNRQFGKLTVINRGEDYITPKGKKYPTWNCICECKNTINVLSSNLLNNTTNSCGCIKEEGNNTKHNKCYTKLYKIYKNIEQRCYNSNSKGFQYYGKRNIKMCEEWLNSFESFYNWAINNGYKQGLTIDRIEVNGNYEPSNCRWVTMKVQNYNRRTTHHLTFNNETHTLEEWSNITGIRTETLQSRLDRKWDIEKVLTQPIKKRKN